MNTNHKTALGLEENLEALLCYLFGFVSGIIFLLLEPDNRYVRFHAWQSTAIYVGLLVLWMVLAVGIGLVGLIPFLGTVITILYRVFSFVVGVLVLGLWVFLMYKAYQGEKYKVPVAGDFAENRLR